MKKVIAVLGVVVLAACGLGEPDCKEKELSNGQLCLVCTVTDANSNTRVSSSCDTGGPKPQ